MAAHVSTKAYNFLASERCHSSKSLCREMKRREAEPMRGELLETRVGENGWMPEKIDGQQQARQASEPR